VYFSWDCAAEIVMQDPGSGDLDAGDIQPANLKENGHMRMPSYTELQR